MDNQNNGINLQKNEETTPMVSEGGVSGSLSVPTAGTVVQTPLAPNMKFCKFCGSQIPADAVLCTTCGRQVEQLQGANSAQPQVVINNSNNNVANATAVAAVGINGGKKKSKWVCLCLWAFLGFFGGHKFYDGKIGTGILYACTCGLLGIGWFIDLFAILNKPNPYYV